MNPKRATKIYRIIDKILLPETTPIIGSLFVKSRIHFARKISKNISKINGFCKGIVFSEEISIGKNNYIGRNIFFDKCISIGENNMIGRNCSFYTTNHKKLDIGWSKYDFTQPKPIKIGNNCWICSDCIVRGGVTVGDNSCVAAGSVVTHDVPPNVLVAGNPAKIVKHYKNEKN